MTPHPLRLQRSRQFGWRKPSCSVIVTRPGVFGNPFTDHSAEKNVELFRKWLLGESMHGMLPDRRREILSKIPLLRGKQLTCFCSLDSPCHADVLCELANRPRGVMQTTPTNCFRACVATVLNVPIEIVPEECDAARWDFDVFSRWLLYEHKMQTVEIVIHDQNQPVVSQVEYPVLCILTVESNEPTTGKHCVVAHTNGRDGYTVLHDPSSEKNRQYGKLLFVMFFVNVVDQKTLLEF